jgi:hypothetical protein
MIVLLFLFIIIIGSAAYLFTSYQYGFSSEETKEKAIVRFFQALNPASWFSGKDKDDKVTEYDRGLTTYQNMKIVCNAIQVFEEKEGKKVDSLTILVDKGYIKKYELHDGWKNEITYSRQLARLRSKGSDEKADTEDDWIMEGNGKFKKIPRGFIVETLEKNNSVMSD